MRSAAEVEMCWTELHRGTVRAVAWGSSLLFVLYMAVDWLAAPGSVSRTLPWRLAGAVMCAAGAAMSESPRFKRLLPWLLAIGSPCSAAVVSVIFLYIHRNPMLVIAAQLQVLMCLGIVAVLRTGIWTTLPVMLLSLNVGLVHMDATWQEFALVNFLIGAAQLMLLAVCQQAHHTFRLRLELEDRLRREASFDFLTGLFNRRAFFEAGRRLWSGCGREQASVCTMLVDIDHFKLINDSHGHEAGDLVLQQLSSLIQAQVRMHDVLCRFGGEEFALLLPGTALAEASQVAERIRLAVEKHEFRVANRSPLRCSVSIGLVHSRPPATTLESALMCSDQAMYQSKKDGRNRITHWAP
ncbi:MAG: GGDEF domain-containing protein [Curvibacter sp.]|nr:GGDEF domain-containing protein [Curvibacter sp.]